MKRATVALCLASSVVAIQLPFELPFFKSKTAAPSAVEEVPGSVPRVAIIGAGAGGSSAAFWISKAKERYGLDVEVDVYEKASYVGGSEWRAPVPSDATDHHGHPGSTTVYPYNDTTLPELELGASIFVKANKNLWRASDEFNLTRRDFREEDYETGIWDGQQFILNVSQKAAHTLHLRHLTSPTVQGWMVGHAQSSMALWNQCASTHRNHVGSSSPPLGPAHTFQCQGHDQLVPQSLLKRHPSVGEGRGCFRCPGFRGHDLQHYGQILCLAGRFSHLH